MSNNNDGAADLEEDREQRFEKLQSILDKHSVTIIKKDQLAVLEDYNFLVICDDSESMKMSAKPKEQRKLGEKPLTRWMELQDGVMLLIDMLGCFRPEGIDVYFLNSGKVPKVQSSAEERLQNIFQGGPQGKTPLTQTLKQVAHDAESEMPYVLFIFTDGEPDGGARKFTKVLTDLVSQKICRAQFRVQIMACSNNDDEIAWLADLDQDSELIDVTDDYYNEKKKIIAMKGHEYAFTRSDWLCKAILGPIEKSVDGVNETLMDKLGLNLAFPGKLGGSKRNLNNNDDSGSALETPGSVSGGACSACAVS